MATPVPNATQSFWRSDLHTFDNHRTTEQLPAEADIVIIGAGYAGASITHHLLEKSLELGKSISIVILEAREACSGATGRNGGHLKPDPYYRAAGALKTHGREAAEEVSSFESRQVKEVQKLVEKENIDCDFVVTRATDVCMYEDARRDLKQGLDALRKADVTTASEVHYSDARSAQGVGRSVLILRSWKVADQRTTGIWRQRCQRLLHIHCRPRLAIQASSASATESSETRCQPADKYSSEICKACQRSQNMGSRNSSWHYPDWKSDLC